MQIHNHNFEMESWIYDKNEMWILKLYLILSTVFLILSIHPNDPYHTDKWILDTNKGAFIIEAMQIWPKSDPLPFCHA